MGNESYLTMIPVKRLSRCPIQLRTVRKDTLEYVMLRDSIRDNGLNQPLLVRPVGDDFQVVLGQHRYEILTDLRVGEAPCYVRDMTDEQVRIAQIESEAGRITTKPVEYARRLWNIVHHEQSLTIQQIAHEVHQTVDWVHRMIGLANLGPAGRAALEQGRLSVSIAVELAKLPLEDQQRMLALSHTMPAGDFRDLIQGEARHQREGTKDVRVERKLQDALQPVYRSYRETCNERLTPAAAGLVLSRLGLFGKDHLAAWRACLDWILLMDKDSLERREKRRRRSLDKEAQLEALRKTENEIRRTENGES